jgi:hypothetical protein
MLMKIFSALTNQGHSRHLSDQEDKAGFSYPKPCSFDECIQAAKTAVRYGQWRDGQARLVWEMIKIACREIGVSFQAVLESDYGDGATILEKCMEARDWESCVRIIPDLPDGIYCNGRVECSMNALMLNADHEGKRIGILRSPDGRYYAGELKGRLMHGSGLLKISERELFNGNFVDNQSHGWGVRTRDGKVIEKGVYANDVYKGDPSYIPKPKRNSFLDYLHSKLP